MSKCGVRLLEGVDSSCVHSVNWGVSLCLLQLEILEQRLEGEDEALLLLYISISSYSCV